MRAIVLTGAIALALSAAAAAALAQPDTAAPPRTRNESPVWVRQPTSADIARTYPDAAAKREASGDVLLTCKVTATGSLEQCVIQKETPEGLGFGQAALKLQPLFEMTPKVKGASVAGASVTIPIGFRMSRSGETTPSSAP